MRKKILPIFAAILLIIIVAGIGVLTQIIEKYTPSDDRMETKEYFSVSSDEELALVLGNELIENKGRVYDGVPYLDYDTVKDYLNQRFYWDSTVNMMLFTTPTDLIKVEVGSKDFYVTNSKQSENYIILKVDGSQAFIAAEFVQKYTNMDYTLANPEGEPARLLVNYQWGSVEMAEIKKSDSLRREGGIKSLIVADVEKGTPVYIIEELDDWSKVRTEDGYIGYIQNSKLSGYHTEELTREFEEFVYTNLTRDYTINMVYHMSFNQDANDTLINAIADVKGVNVIAPTWFSVQDTSGNITSVASKDYVNRAKNVDMEVWATVDSWVATEYQLDIAETLMSSSARENLSSQLVAAAIEYNLDGINVDFEGIPEEGGEAYIQFIRELSIKCRKNGIVLSVANPVPMPYTEHYHLEEQGKIVDYVVIMSYDEHYDGGDAGTVSSLSFVENAIQGTLAKVPADKVINAVPFYTRVWSISNTDGKVESDTYGMNRAENFLNEYEVEPDWDEETSQYYGEVALADATYKVWLEEERSLDLKVQLIKEYDLAGTAAWALGYERSTIWDVILKYTN